MPCFRTCSQYFFTSSHGKGEPSDNSPIFPFYVLLRSRNWNMLQLLTAVRQLVPWVFRGLACSLQICRIRTPNPGRVPSALGLCWVFIQFATSNTNAPTGGRVPTVVRPYLLYRAHAWDLSIFLRWPLVAMWECYETLPPELAYLHMMHSFFEKWSSLN